MDISSECSPLAKIVALTMEMAVEYHRSQLFIADWHKVS